MVARFAVALPVIIVILACSSEEMTACEPFEPPGPEKQVESMTPNEVVEQIIWDVRSRLQCNQDYFADNPDQLYQDINDILLPRFDRQYAAKQVLARHWRAASTEQRERLANALYPRLTRLYARIVLFSDLEKLEILLLDGDAAKKHTTVKTIMVAGDGTKIPVRYAMVKHESGWLMFDLSIEGISYVRNFRAELDSEIPAIGLDGVLARLEADTSDSTVMWNPFNWWGGRKPW